MFIIAVEDSSAALTKQKFRKFLKRVIKTKASKFEIYKIFDEFDKNKDGFLDYKEFFNIFAPFNKEYRRNLRRKEGARANEIPIGGVKTTVGNKSNDKKFQVYKGFNLDREKSIDRKSAFLIRGRSPRNTNNASLKGGRGTWGANTSGPLHFMKGGKGVDSFKDYTLTTKKSIKNVIRLTLLTSKNFDYSKALIQDHLFSFFCMMDKNARGEISLRNLGDVLLENGVETKTRELQAVIRKFDLNFNGRVSFDELYTEMSPKVSSIPRRRRNRAF